MRYRDAARPVQDTVAPPALAKGPGEMPWRDSGAPGLPSGLSYSHAGSCGATVAGQVEMTWMGPLSTLCDEWVASPSLTCRLTSIAEY